MANPRRTRRSAANRAQTARGVASMLRRTGGTATGMVRSAGRADMGRMVYRTSDGQSGSILAPRVGINRFFQSGYSASGSSGG